MQKLALVVLAAFLAVTLFAVMPGGTTTVQADDACGNPFVDVPDSGATFDFHDACHGHDDCYAAGGDESDRRACDRAFLSDMRSSCEAMWPQQFFRRAGCLTVAHIYYAGVAIGGAFFL